VVAIAIVFVAWPAAAQRSRRVMQACERTYQRAVKLERAGRLVQAHEAMETCATSVCGEFLHHQCAAGRDRIAADTPSIVPIVTGDDGATITDVEVAMDGETITSMIDGLAIHVDPGPHEITFTRRGEVIATQKIVAMQGKRNQPIAVQLHTPKPVPALAQPQLAAPQVPVAVLSEVPEQPAPKRGSYLGSYVLLGSGALALAGYGVLTYWGSSDNDQLAKCTPNCLQSSVDHIHDLYLAANISLGVGVAAALTGGWLWWRTHSRVSVQVGPTYASVGGVF
jgi:hypothetical protein